MHPIQGDLKENTRRQLMTSGAVAVGFALAEAIPPDVAEGYEGWIGEGKNAGMEYLKRHAPLRQTTDSVLPGTKTVISIAFSYAPAKWRNPSLPQIACYAYGKDYHDVIRSRLTPIVETLKSQQGGDWRICIDSAPVSERFWALRSGIGIKGENGSVIVKNSGSYVFLAEVLTTLEIKPDKPSRRHCKGCGACRAACPAHALSADGTIDSCRCINYLTIEHRGEWDGIGLETMQTPIGKNSIFGCDICQRVCPHNRDIIPTSIEEFKPLPGVMELDADDIIGMTKENFTAFFKGSAIKRAKYEGLRRNARNVVSGLSTED